MLFSRRNKMRKIRNRTIVSYEDLMSQLKAVQTEMSDLQREKDMKITQISNKYEERIELLIRTENLIKDEMARVKNYIAPKQENEVVVSLEHSPLDDIIPTPANMKKYDKKSSK